MEGGGPVLAWLKRSVCAEEGATMVEYGLMLTLIALVCIGAVSYIGSQANTLFTGVGDGF